MSQQQSRLPQRIRKTLFDPQSYSRSFKIPSACIVGSVDVKTFITSIDAQCPQIAPFGVMRCLGHQHIGDSMTKLYAAHG